MLFFTSDHHFYHKNSLNFGGRDVFRSMSQMHSRLIGQWNNVVGDDDTVWHLGDLSFGCELRTKSILEKLNGRIKILSLPWHHDKDWVQTYHILFGRREPWLSASGWPVTLWGSSHVLLLDPEPFGLDFDGYPFTIHLSHYPIRDWEGAFYGTSLHLHGHQHKGNGDAHIQGMAMNVNVEFWDWKPLSLERIVEIMYQDRV